MPCRKNVYRVHPFPCSFTQGWRSPSNNSIRVYTRYEFPGSRVNKSGERWIDYEKLIHWIHRNIIAIIDIILNWLIINFRLVPLTFRIVNNLQNLKTKERTKRRDRMQIFRGERKEFFFKFTGRSVKFIHTNARSCNLNRDEKLSLMQKNRHEKEKWNKNADFCRKRQKTNFTDLQDLRTKCSIMQS